MIAAVALWLATLDPAMPPTTAANTLVAPLPPPPSPSWTVPVVHSAGLLVGMRLVLSVAWPDAYDPLPLSRSGRQFARAFTEPPDFRRDRPLLESDGDPWTINVFGHGLFGAEVYGRVRQCGGRPWQAFAFAAGTSALWEFGIESFNKRPSAIDLVSTPILGAVLGEGRVQAQRWLRRRRPGFWRAFAEIVVDPLGQTERLALRTHC